METTGKATMEELRAFATENREFTDEKTGKTVKIEFLIGGTVCWEETQPRLED